MDQITQPTAEQREQARAFWRTVVTGADDHIVLPESASAVPDQALGLAACGVIVSQLSAVVVDDVHDWLAIMAAMAFTTGDQAAMQAADHFALWHVESLTGFVEAAIASGLDPEEATWADTLAYCAAQATSLDDDARGMALLARLDQVRAAMQAAARES